MLMGSHSKFLGGGRLPVPVPTLGAELVLNGGFDADASWSKDAGWTISGGNAIHTGASSTLSQGVLTSGAWYQGRYDVVSATLGVRMRFGSAGNLGKRRTVAGTYYDVLRADGATAGLLDDSDSVTDNVSFKAITLASMFSARAYGTHVTVKAAATVTAGTRAGVVCNLDSATAPANFVIASHDSVTCRLTKCVGGTYTELLAVTTTYAAGAYVEIRRILGTNDYELWYNGAQVGASQTITDAGIISNTLAGMFQTYAGNTLAAFSCVPSTVPSYAWATAGGAPTPVAAYMPKGATSLAASYVNLANVGTNHAAPGTAPTFAAATGWGFTGSQDLSTGIQSASNMTIICRFSGSTGDWRALFGSDTSSNGIYAQVRYTTGTVHTYNNGTTRISIAGALTSGVVAIAGAKGYLDGVEETAALNNSIGTPATIYIGCRLSNSVITSSYAGSIQAIAIYSSVLTAPQIAAVTAAMQAL